MTFENAKRLYEHFKDKGMIAEAENLLIRRPELKPVEVKPKTNSKSKGEK